MATAAAEVVAEVVAMALLLSGRLKYEELLMGRCALVYHSMSSSSYSYYE